jgi:hypothetical protein
MAYKAGFNAGHPKVMPPGTNTTGYGPPVWADLGLTPGRKSLVFGTADKRLWVVNYDGSVAAGWPKTLPGQPNTPTVADIDGDGIPEILVGFGGRYLDPANIGGVRAFERNGAEKWTVYSFNEPNMNPPNTFPLGVVSTPAVGDVDGDGQAEVVWGGFDGHIYVVNGATGADKPNWPIFIHDTIWSSPALYDLDNSGTLEIIIGTDSHLEQQAVPEGVPGTIEGGRLHVLRSNASEFPGFPYDTDQVIFSAPVVGDIDGDGKPEIVFGTGTYYGNPAPCGVGSGGGLRRRTVYALHCDGTPVAGFGVANMTHGEVVGSPALADLDGDGHPEVIVSDLDCSTGQATWNNYNVYAFKGTKGSLNYVPLWKVMPKAYSGYNLSAGQPVVADVLGDIKPEVLVATNTEIAIISSTGVQLTDSSPVTPSGPSLYAPTAISDPAVDVDNGIVNIASVSGMTPYPGTNAVVYMWTTAKSVAPTWGQVRRTPDHTGAMPGSGACGVVIPPLGATQFFTVPPCRAVDTRNADGPEGGPTFSAGLTRAFNIAGLCGVPVNATGISLNVTVAGATTKSWLTIFPGTGTVPTANSISFNASASRANNVTLGLTNGALSVKNRQTTGTVDVILDVNGYYK